MSRSIMGGGRRGGALAAIAAVAALAGASPALAAPFNVGSGTLTWNVPHDRSPGTGTLSNYATTIGNGDVSAAAPATGGPITRTSTPLAGPGVSYPFAFPTSTTGTPATPTGAAGTYDPETKTGAINFAGTVTFTAHGGVFFSVVNPRLQFDAPQSIRVVANGQVAAGSIGENAPPATYGTGPTRQTVFALDGTAATTAENPDGSYTISNLRPSPTSSTPPSFISSNAVFDGVRTWFQTDRPNQGFAVTFAPVGAEPPPPPPPPTGSSKELGVSGTVGEALSLQLNSPTASLGAFQPGVAANYDTTVTGTATSTGPSALTVHDTDTTSPGFLVNGTRPLASPLSVCATNAAAPTCAYGALSATPRTLLSYTGGTSASPLTVGLRQAISASEPLTAGTYGKTLTFTLSTATP